MTLPTRWLPLLALCALASPVAAAERLWTVRAITPDGASLEIKAFDAAGKGWEIRAVEEDGDTHLMDIKAISDGKRLPVKVLAGDDALAPVRAIADDGKTFDLKAVGSGGVRLDVRAVGRAGNIFHIKAVAPGWSFYGVKAISPEGHFDDVKGVKLGADRVEGRSAGVEFIAHVKALPQICSGSEGDGLWHVRAVAPDGRLLPVQAFDKAGKGWDVESIEESGNLHFMDVKALVAGRRLPVKLVGVVDKELSLEAIGEDGARLSIRAVGPGGEQLPIRGGARAGNIIGIKAIGPGGAAWGVKAVSPRGLLHDVKGIRLGRDPVEGKVGGVEVAAHVKAVPQAAGGHD